MPNELSQIMDSRANMFNLLARVYRKEVDKDFLNELTHIRYPQNTGDELVDISYRYIHRYLCNAREATLDELAIDYARVFLGLGCLDSHAAYPYESVYTSEKGLRMQEARDAVVAIYHQNSVVKDESWKEPEDHIAAELEFMKIMSIRCRDLLEEEKEDEARTNVEAQRAFLSEHLLNWTGKFFDDVPVYSVTDFYCAFAELSRSYLAGDLALLDELLSEPFTDVTDENTETPADEGTDSDVENPVEAMEAKDEGDADAQA